MTAPAVRRRLRVTGRVQGVGFRWFTRAQARDLGLSGWVRNEHDGTVLCEVQGPGDLVDQMLDRLRRGPPGAHVTQVSTDPLTLVDDDDDFRIHP